MFIFKNVFNNVRNTLVNPIQGETRQQISNFAACAKGYFGFSMGSMGCIAATALIVSRVFPITGEMVALVGFMGSIGAREAMIVSENTEEIMKGNVWDRVAAAWSASAFTQKLTKNTWIVGPVFGSAIEVMLQNGRIENAQDTINDTFTLS